MRVAPTFKIKSNFVGKNRDTLNKMKKPVKDILYVSIQLLLFFLYLFNIQKLNLHFPGFMKGIGYAFFIIGIAMAIVSILSLKSNLSPFPSPKPGSELIQSGLYRYIRHPIYFGILIAGSGLSLSTNSGYRLMITVLLFVLFYFKTEFEEKKLLEKYEDYKNYMKRTGRFLPKFGKHQN